MRVFFWARQMDPDEYETYLDQIDAMDPLLRQREVLDENENLCEQLRDDHGWRVPGCYRVLPASFE